MAEVAQIDLLSASQVAQQTPIQQAANGICYGAFADTGVPPQELEQMVQAVPDAIAAALARQAYYFVPLTIGETEETMVARGYTVDLSDRAICHRNVRSNGAECIFISTRLMQDRFALAFEFFINVAHHFVEAAGVPQSFSDLVWAQAASDVRGETSQDSYENRKRALDRGRNGSQSAARVPERSLSRSKERGPASSALRSPLRSDESSSLDEKAKSSYFDSAFSDAIAIYMLSLAMDFNYADLREREYPLLAPPALAERLRHVAELFPANRDYSFQILYRPKNG